MAGWRGGESRGLGGPDRGCPVGHGPTLPFCISTWYPHGHHKNLYSFL